MYMSPVRLKLSIKHKKLPLDLLVKSDAFSVGLSSLVMGNLRDLKEIKLNKNKTLLT